MYGSLSTEHDHARGKFAVFQQGAIQKLPASVNFMWLNPPGFEDQDPDALCHIRLSFLDRVYEAAKAQPHLEFNIWIDKQRLSPLSAYFIASQAYLMQENGNVQIKNIRDLPEFCAYPYCEQENPLRAPGTPSSLDRLAAYIDLYKLLIIKKELGRNDIDVQAAFFSDLDLPSYEINSDINLRIKKHGVCLAFGGAYTEIIENQFFGFAKSRLSDVEELAELTISDISIEHKQNGFFTLTKYFDSLLVRTPPELMFVNHTIKRGSKVGMQSEANPDYLGIEPRVKAKSLSANCLHHSV